MRNPRVAFQITSRYNGKPLKYWVLVKVGLAPTFCFRWYEMEQRADRVQALIEPGISAMGYELLGVEYLSQGRHSVLRIYIDHVDGIGVEDCQAVSRQISGVLDVEDPIQGQYNLEVSSPGLERPLFSLAQYARFVGENVAIRLGAPLDGRRKFSGRLKAVENEEVVIEQDGEEFVIPYASIDKGHLRPEW